MSTRDDRCCKTCGKRYGPFKNHICSDCFHGTTDPSDDEDGAQYCKVCRRFLYKNISEIDHYCFDCVGRCGICSNEHNPSDSIVRPLDDHIRELIDQVDDVEAVLGDTKNGEEFVLCRRCARKHDKMSNKKPQHCMRCHQDFYESGSSSANKDCVIEHDEDSFEGGRHGGSNWYTGILRCCGANYRFHRHYSESKASPKYCYKGPHTSDADLVDYNNMLTISVCDADDCGQELHEAAQAAKTKQQQKQLQEEENEKKATETYWKNRIDAAPNKRREKRKADAARLDLYDGTDSDDFNSDIDPEGCEEFDYASDSSLTPFA